MKIYWILFFILSYVSDVKAADVELRPYVAQCGEVRIRYALPSGAHYLAGDPVSTVEFPANRGFPLMGGIAGIGWAFLEGLPQVQIDLLVVKISNPRFDCSVSSQEWQKILEEERVSVPITGEKRVSVTLDQASREWLEAIVEKGNLVSGRSYIRPIAPNLLVLLRLDFGGHVTPKQRVEALEVQRAMLNVLDFPR